jgi:hypothetical protein
MTFQEVYEWLNKNGVLKKFVYLDEEILIALDGTEYFSSKKISCPHCNCRNHRNGTTTYFHGCVTPSYSGREGFISWWEYTFIGVVVLWRFDFSGDWVAGCGC